jgi:hypothetical protein
MCCEQASDVNQGERDELDKGHAEGMRNVFKMITETHGAQWQRKRGDVPVHHIEVISGIQEAGRP